MINILFKEALILIEIKNLSKSYGPFKAVDNLSFTIDNNCVFGFLGPNGAGKSTTMNMITGCLSPTEGEIYINGLSMTDNPEEAKKNIGYLPEIPPVYEDLTPLEYLSFVGEAKKIPKAQLKEKIAQVMEKTSITAMKNRLIKNLSKGYRQRVGIAQAILGDPPVIILDEPTVGLDPQQIIEIRNLITELGKSHIVILSSHILSEISAVCSRIMIISHGKLVALDSAQKLVGNENTEKTAVLEALGSSDKILNVLKTTPGVISAELSQETGNTCKFSFMPENDPRERLFYSLAEADCPVISLYIKKSSLEEIFLEIIAESGSYSKNTTAGGVK